VGVKGLKRVIQGNLLSSHTLKKSTDSLTRIVYYGIESYMSLETTQKQHWLQVLISPAGNISTFISQQRDLHVTKATLFAWGVDPSKMGEV